MILIKGCTSDLIEDITKKVGSLTMLDVTSYFPFNDSDDMLYDIEISSKRVAVIFHDNDLVLQRLDVNDNRHIHIDSCRFREAVIQ